MRSFLLLMALSSCAALVSGAGEASGAGTKPTVVEAVLGDVSLGVYDKDAEKPSSPHTIKAFSKLGTKLAVDEQQKIWVKFSLTARGGGALPFKPQQAFAYFEHKETGAEIVFLFEQLKDSGDFLLDRQLTSKEFGGLSGLFSLRLIVGDAQIKEPIDYVIVDVDVRVAAQPPPVVRKSQEINYDKLPEIKHKFREPEKRPPAFISDAFSIICLVPLGLLLILWLGIGINFGNMPISIWTPIFHISLAGLFFVYLKFWLSMTMPETLKYTALVGAIIFFSGIRLLRLIADRRKQKTE